MNELNQNSYSIHISGKRKLINFNFREIWKYRDLILLFVKRDFTAEYKQTLLGPLWAVINPVLTTVFFTVIFGNLAKLTTLDVITEEKTSVPAFLFYLSGTICWSLFSSILSRTSNTFSSNRNILGKVYFPRMVMPLATACSRLVSFFIEFGLFIVLWMIWLFRGETTMRLSGFAFLIPLLLLQLMLLGMGIGIIISSLTTKYKDLNMMVSFFTRLMQYATPVAYGLTLIPERYLSFYLLNPVTVIVTAFRCAFFGEGFFNLFYYGIGWVITLVIFVIGMLMFNYVEKTFMDTI